MVYYCSRFDAVKIEIDLLSNDLIDLNYKVTNAKKETVCSLLTNKQTNSLTDIMSYFGCDCIGGNAEQDIEFERWAWEEARKEEKRLEELEKQISQESHSEVNPKPNE